MSCMCVCVLGVMARIFLLLCFVFVLISCKRCLVNSISLNYTKYRHVSSSRLARIQSHLDKINKPPVFTIQSQDGDIIDCIPKRKQPALDHPLLKHHKIQIVPPEMPKVSKTAKTNITTTVESVDGHMKGAWQMWHQKGRSCPKGTIPIRRSSVHDVLRAKSLYRFGRKQPESLPRRRAHVGGQALTGLNDNYHEHAVAFTTASQEIYGAKAAINVWKPTLEAFSEFSLSQIWVTSGSFENGSDLNSIEVGWQADQVNKQLYGDNKPRLFTYWTRDAYQSTGCYNLLCSGFVQKSRQIAMGATIVPVSAVGGDQFEMIITIWRDPKEGNWWMAFGDKIVGYWPKEIFTHLADRATMIEWGGEIVNSRPNNKHTSTQMGSGHFAEEGYGKASYFRNLEIVDSENKLGSAQGVETIAENPNCYNIQSSRNKKWGSYFYYGGPGRSPRCP
ncbi:hypothetical protein OROMI_010344 [Orobanche minor]